MKLRNTARATWATGMLVPAALVATVTQPAAAHGGDQQERFLYVSTIAQSATDPDFIAVIGADPEQPDFGQIVNRVDMPNVGDELHHFGYSADQSRLIVPGLFSSRIHVFDIGSDGSTMTLDVVNEDLVTDSGYAVPHGVMAVHGMLLAPMIGAANDQTQPGGIVQIDDRTGEFVDYFGPGPERTAAESGPTYMYDFAMTPDGASAISSTFGSPALCAPGIDPTCLGDEVSVWDVESEAVVQTADLGANSGALMVRFVDDAGVRRAFINTPGTSAVWLASDDDGDGEFDVRAGARCRRRPRSSRWTLSCRTTAPRCTCRTGSATQCSSSTSAIPSTPCSARRSRCRTRTCFASAADDGRLYVSNSLLTPWDNDANFGEARNSDYGIWLFEVDSAGELTPAQHRRERLGQLRRRREADDHRPGRTPHDGVRPDGGDGGGRALTSE